MTACAVDSACAAAMGVSSPTTTLAQTLADSCIAGIRAGSVVALLGWLRPPVQRSSQGSYLVDPASSHMLVSKIKPCMSKYKLLIL